MKPEVRETKEALEAQIKSIVGVGSKAYKNAQLVIAQFHTSTNVFFYTEDVTVKEPSAGLGVALVFCFKAGKDPYAEIEVWDDGDISLTVLGEPDRGPSVASIAIVSKVSNSDHAVRTMSEILRKQLRI